VWQYLRSLSSNLWSSLSVHIFWSWIKNACHTRARSLRRGRGRGCPRRINCDVKVPPPAPARLYKMPFLLLLSSSIHTKVFMFRRPHPQSLCLLLLSHSHRLHRAHRTGKSRTSGTFSCCWDPARDWRAIRFLGSIFTRLLAPVRILPLCRLRTTTSSTAGSSLRSSTCTEGYIDWGHFTISMTDPSDSEKSGDAVTLPSTGYILNLVFMFISCIITHILMFYYCLNINICTWIVSLTVILKCLFNYGIKIYWNTTYHLTIQNLIMLI
jgi:hypothetical protein